MCTVHNFKWVQFWFTYWNTARKKHRIKMLMKMHKKKHKIDSWNGLLISFLTFLLYLQFFLNFTLLFSSCGLHYIAQSMVFFLIRCSLHSRRNGIQWFYLLKHDDINFNTKENKENHIFLFHICDEFTPIQFFSYARWLWKLHKSHTMCLAVYIWDYYYVWSELQTSYILSYPHESVA